MQTITNNTALLETYSIVDLMGEKLNKWNDKNIDEKSKVNRVVSNVLKPLVVRIVGCVAVVFCALADLFLHLALFMAKLIAAPLALPIRICVKDFTKELHLSSPIKHLINTLRSLIDVVFLPGLWLLDPKAAYEHAAIHISNVNQNSSSQKSSNSLIPPPLEISEAGLETASEIRFVLPPPPNVIKDVSDDETSSIESQVDSDNESSSEEFQIRTIPLTTDEDDEIGLDNNRGFKLHIRECQKKNDMIDSSSFEVIEDSFNQALQGFQAFTWTPTVQEQKRFDEEFNRRKNKVEKLNPPAFKRWCITLKDFLSALHDKHADLKEIRDSTLVDGHLASDRLSTPQRLSCKTFKNQLSSNAKDQFQTSIKTICSSSNIQTVERELKLYEKLMKYFEPKLKALVELQRDNSSTTSEKQMEITNERLRLAKEKEQLKQERLKAVSFVTDFYGETVDIKEKLKEEINLRKALLEINQKLSPAPQYASLDPFYTRMDQLKAAIENDQSFEDSEYESIKNLVSELNNPTFYKAQVRQF